jgi:hypothetical protein
MTGPLHGGDHGIHLLFALVIGARLGHDAQDRLRAALPQKDAAVFAQLPGTLLHSRLDLGILKGGVLSSTFTFFSTWGYMLMPEASTERGSWVSIITPMSLMAVIRPSPVWANLRKMMAGLLTAIRWSFSFMFS